MKLFVILLSNSSRQVAIIGTKLGQPFTSEDMAKKVAKEWEEKHPAVDVLVMPIEARYE